MKYITSFVLVCCVIINTNCNTDDLNPSLVENTGLPVHYNDDNATTRLKVAVVSLNAAETKEENIAKMTAMINEIMATHPNTRLIAFGETVLGYYYAGKNSKEYHDSIAETIPGYTTNLFGSIAQTNNIYIAYGLGEIDGDKRYNSLVLIDPSGTIIAKHRKVNLYSYDKDYGFSPGAKSTIPIASIDGVKTGFAICADGQDYWLTKKIVEAKVKLVIHPLADETNEFLIGSGRQYNAWVISANRTGKEKDHKGTDIYFDGYHFISDPAGGFKHFSEGDERYDVAEIGIY